MPDIKPSIAANEADHLSSLLRLRLLVGFLGERAQYAWWPTAFYEPSSRLFLEPAFAKTSRLAQYHGVVEAARRVHDEHLNIGSFHLFRLPEEVEQDLHGLVLGSSDDTLAKQAPQQKSAAIDALTSLAPKSAGQAEGPSSVGSIGELHSPRVLKAFAGAYQSAFAQGSRIYPYLVG